jgi:hypothetical protein
MAVVGVDVVAVTAGLPIRTAGAAVDVAQVVVVTECFPGGRREIFVITAPSHFHHPEAIG